MVFITRRWLWFEEIDPWVSLCSNKKRKSCKWLFVRWKRELGHMQTTIISSDYLRVLVCARATNEKQILVSVCYPQKVWLQTGVFEVKRRWCSSEAIIVPKAMPKPEPPLGSASVSPTWLSIINPQKFKGHGQEAAITWLPFLRTWFPAPNSRGPYVDVQVISADTTWIAKESFIARKKSGLVKWTTHQATSATSADFLSCVSITPEIEKNKQKYCNKKTIVGNLSSIPKRF